MSVIALDINQLDPGFCREFRVQAEYVDRERYFIDHALSWTVTAREKLQVLNRVVLSIAIDVMNRLFGQKLPPKMLFHDVTVFEHLTLDASVEIGGKRQPNISVPFNVAPDFAREKSFFSLTGRPCVFAFRAAKALLGIKFVVSCRALVTAPRHFFAALLAIKELFVFCRMSAASDTVTLTRAKTRIATVLGAVGIKKSGKHLKRFAAVFAGKFYTNASFSARTTVLGLIGDHAGFGAVPFGFSGFCSGGEGGPAFYAVCCDERRCSHGFLQWSDKRWYIPLLRRSQVRKD